MRFRWFHKYRNDDLDAEVQSHLSMAARERIERGQSPAAAARGAHGEFGNDALVRDVTRDQWSFRWLSELVQDLRYAERTLRKTPAFTAIAVLTLALGIGVNTTLFSAFNAVALKPLPVSDPRSVVRLVRWFASGRLGTPQFLFSYPEYVAYRDHNSVFASLIAVSLTRSVSAVVPTTSEAGSPSSEPIALRGQLVSTNYFSDLGVDTILGRGFPREGDGAPGALPVIVLSYPCWQRRFAADPQVVGRIVRLNEYSFTVIGVAPREFIGTANPPEVPDFWTPLAMQPQLVPGQDWLNQFHNHQFQLLARLRHGVPLAQAAAAMQNLVLNLEQAHPMVNSADSATTITAQLAAYYRTTALTLQHATYFGETSDLRFRAFVALLMFVVGAVLLVACANLANMLMARSANRQREIGIRLALGAGRGRVIRQLLTESVLLALFGGAAGLLFAFWAGQLLWVSISELVRRLFYMDPALIHVTPDLRVFSYALGLSVLTGMIFGLLPALRSSRVDPTESLKEEGSAFGRRFSRSWLRNAMVIAQVAVTLMLLVTSGLLIRGLLRSQTTNTGFETRKVFPMGLAFNSDPAKTNAIAQRILDRLRVAPAVEGVGLVEHVPMLSSWTAPVVIENSSASPRDLPSTSLANRVSRGYFPVLGIPIVHGRNFEANEDLISAPVAIISESAARRFWPGVDPLGRRLKFNMQIGRGDPLWKEFEVIGVVRDIRSSNLTRVDPTILYFPSDATQLFNYAALVRLPDSSESTQAQVRLAVESAVGRPLPGYRLVSLEDDAVRVQRLMPQTFAFFAIILATLALTLASVGVYGIVAFAVSQRTREIGVRMALGARPADVLRLVASQGMAPVLIGAIIGLALSSGVSGILRALLALPGAMDLFYGVSAFDPATFAGISLLLGAVALAACYIPARRAMRVDPTVALRYE